MTSSTSRTPVQGIAKYTYWIFIAVAGVIMLAGGMSIAEHFYARAKYQRTTATVTDIKKQTSSTTNKGRNTVNNRTTNYYVYTYSVDGRSYSRTYENRVGKQALAVGDTTTIHYNPSNPYDIVEVDAKTSLNMGLILLSLGGSLAAIITAGRIFLRRRATSQKNHV